MGNWCKAKGQERVEEREGGRPDSLRCPFHNLQHHFHLCRDKVVPDLLDERKRVRDVRAGVEKQDRNRLEAGEGFERDFRAGEEEKDGKGAEGKDLRRAKRTVGVSSWGEREGGGDKRDEGANLFRRRPLRCGADGCAVHEADAKKKERVALEKAGDWRERGEARGELTRQ